MKRGLVWLLTVLVLLPILGIGAGAAGPQITEGVVDGDYVFDVIDGDAVIVEYHGDAQNDLVIPHTLSGYAVTAIGESAFWEHTELKTVVIPQGVTAIGRYAFLDCTNLEKITIPEGVVIIDEMAFELCDSLSAVNIPASVQAIGNSAFYKGLITVAPENQYYSSRDGVLFNKEQTTLIRYPVNKSGSTYTIPNTVTTLVDYAFYQCKSLTSVVIPSGITQIGIGCFSGCEQLKTVALPTGLTSIGDSAFSFCYSLTDVVLPETLTGVGDDAFVYCYNMAPVTIPDSVVSIGSGAFDCELSVSPNNPAYSVEDGVLFNKNKTLLIRYPSNKNAESYVIPDSVITIGDRAFQECYPLREVTFPNSVTSIGDSAFHYCENLASVVLPKGLTTIGADAFSYCFKLSQAMIPDGVTAVGDYAFYDCNKLTEVVLSDSVVEIGAMAFGYVFDENEGDVAKDNFTIKGIAGSAANGYCEENGFTFTALTQEQLMQALTENDFVSANPVQPGGTAPVTVSKTQQTSFMEQYGLWLLIGGGAVLLIALTVILLLVLKLKRVQYVVSTDEAPNDHGKK